MWCGDGESLMSARSTTQCLFSHVLIAQLSSVAQTFRRHPRGRKALSLWECVIPALVHIRSHRSEVSLRTQDGA